ncbi:MAG TPA: 3-oxoacyl-[acyl-carrier-protein] synthase III C-terminal domain-containing protein [Gammaproteobacteria bacterium]|nr:3-oxoacyl-[acyl-carrier-protein] synthase III C-terminal domain-containing protein [Gammaproteobacteria bacterium]
MLYMNDAKYFIPEKYLTIEQAGKLLNLNDIEIKVYKKIYGIEKIPIAQEIPLLDFIKYPVEEIIKNNNLKKSSIKYLIHCHTAKVIAPFGDSLIRKVKEDLGLNDTIAFGTSINNCASAISSIDMLSHVLASHDECNAIIVCGDYAFTHVLRYIPNTAILGDASTAILLSKQGNKNKLLSSSIKIAGEYAEGIWLSGDKLQSFETQYVHLFSSVILDAINKAGLKKEQINLIIPHNVNIPSWKRVADNINIPLEKIYLENIKKYSHCFGSDTFINYVSAKNESKFNSGDYYLMATVGLGATFAAAVFQH